MKLPFLPHIAITNYLGKTEEIQEQRLKIHIQQRQVLSEMFPDLRILSICSPMTKSQMRKLSGYDCLFLNHVHKKSEKHNLVLKELYTHQNRAVLFLDNDTVPSTVTYKPRWKIWEEGRPSTTKDSLGAKTGTRASRIHLALSKKGKTLRQIEHESQEKGARAYLNKLTSWGILKEEKGKYVWGHDPFAVVYSALSNDPRSFDQITSACRDQSAEQVLFGLSALRAQGKVKKINDKVELRGTAQCPLQKLRHWLLEPNTFHASCSFFCTSLLMDTFLRNRSDPWSPARLNVVGWSIFIRSDLGVFYDADRTPPTIDDWYLRILCHSKNIPVAKTHLYFDSLMPIVHDNLSTLVASRDDRWEIFRKATDQLLQMFPGYVERTSSGKLRLIKKRPMGLIGWDKIK